MLFPDEKLAIKTRPFNNLKSIMNIRISPSVALDEITR